MEFLFDIRPYIQLGILLETSNLLPSRAILLIGSYEPNKIDFMMRKDD